MTNAVVKDFNIARCDFAIAANVAFRRSLGMDYLFIVWDAVWAGNKPYGVSSM